MAAPSDKLSLYVAVEDTSYGVTTASSFPADWDLVEAYDISLSLEQEFRQRQRQNIDFFDSKYIKGEKGGSITFKHELHGHSIAVPSGAASTLNGQFKLLKAVNGIHEYGPAPMTEDAGTSTTTVLNVTSATGVTPGMCLLVPVGGSSTLEPTFAKSISTNAITLSKTLSDTPANGGTIYAGLHFAPLKRGEPSSYSLRLTLVGQNTEDRFDLIGCRGTMTVEIEDNKPIVNYEFKFAAWTTTTHSITDLGTYAFPEAPSAVDILFTYSNAFTSSAAAAHTTVSIAEFSFDPQRELTAQKILNSGITDSTTAELLLTQADTPIVKFTPYFDADWFTDADNQTQKTIMVAFRGSAAGRWVVLYFPACETMSLPEIGDVDGIKSNEISMVAGKVVDSDLTTLREGSGATQKWLTTAIANSPYRICFV